MTTFDLDKARADAGVVEKELVLDGRTWRFKAALVVDVGDHLSAGDFKAALAVLLVDPADTDALTALLGVNEVQAVLEHLYTDELGGSVSLVGFLKEHWDHVEADFQSHYQLDLAAACFGPAPMSVRRLLNLVLHLPQDGAVGQELNPAWWWWKPDTEYAAAQLELLAQTAMASDAARRIMHGAFGARGKPKPLPEVDLPRPWSKQKRRQGFASLIDRATVIVVPKEA